MIFYMFIDGIGFGQNDPTKNPFARYARGVFLPLAEKEFGEGSPSILKELVYLKTDASMGIKGLPQSATGQTSLWTGINACQVLNRHLSGFPTFTLKKIIAKYSIIRILEERGFKADLLNCYTPAYEEYIRKNPRQVSASTLIQMASDKPLKGMDDLREGRGLYMDITREFLSRFGRDSVEKDDPVLIKQKAYDTGKSIVPKLKDHTLCIYEYFITDKVGHKMNWPGAEKCIGDLEDFILGIVEALDPAEDQLIITSDHGNLEDLSVDVHTTNLVPTILFGKYTQKIKETVKAIKDIPHAIYDCLGVKVSMSEQEFMQTTTGSEKPS
ncbi:metalloenzyme [Leptospira perolatii]|uniref:Metalloenzyme n=1 Tax=Leptospira perolatii TaxID=2023191 RepID=A0A2M9ZRZ3_9LEPT|nr:metalloenzyme [Leptospira perolatii]PJZ71262.1 metalloenzyme [Leptospira perolatii]PJZ74795.1 metalloenzyme [Leptospira perolatii]